MGGSRSLLPLGIAIACVAATSPARADDTNDDVARTGLGRDVVRVARSVRVYERPRVRSKLNRGRVARGARFLVVERQPRGHGCSRQWLRIGDDAWICGRATRATDAAPSRVALPRLRKKRLLPHTYMVARNAVAYPTIADAKARTGGKQLAGLGGFIVRDVRRIGGAGYVATSEGWVAARSARIVRASDFRGVELDDQLRAQPLAFVTARVAYLYDERGVRTRAKPMARQFFIGQVGPATRVGRHQLHADTAGHHYRTADIGLVGLSPRPEGVSASERWLDVVISEQTMVAYHGDRPVFATLVSTARTATPKGVFRISGKRAFARIKSSFGGRYSWDLFTPWVMSIRGPIAMHATYWHRQYGKARSHGCINLSPHDARWIWDFTDPKLPPGFTRIEATAAQSGTVIRIR